MSTLPTIFNYNNQVIPHCLFLIKEYKIGHLNDQQIHKYVSTLCSYTTRRFIYLCTGKNVYYEGAVADTNQSEMINAFRGRKNIFVTVCFEYKYANNAHIYGYAKIDGKIYKLESGLNHWSQRVTLVTYRQFAEDLSTLNSRDEIENIGLSTCNIPRIEVVKRNFNSVAGRRVTAKDARIRQVLLDNINYEYV